MPLPKPGPGEGKAEFLERCISFVNNEGLAEGDQAVAICEGIWEDSMGQENGQAERRTLAAGELRLVGGSESENPRILGYAAVFNSPSEDLGGFVEVIEPGFFREVLGGDTRALWNHDRSQVLGRTASGTLTLTEDDHGLRYEIDPPDAVWARDAMASIQRGDVNQSSFAFLTHANGDRWEKRADGVVVRTLLAGGCRELQDVSPVTFPAYPATSAEARAQAEALGADDVQGQDDSGEGQEAGPEGAGEDAEPGVRLPGPADHGGRGPPGRGQRPRTI